MASTRSGVSWAYADSSSGLVNLPSWVRAVATAVASCRVSHNFLSANCGNTTNSETYTPEETGVTYTISDETAAADAYYAPVLSFIINGTASGPIYGTPAHCSNGSCTNVTYAN